jgi:hypothetical protein
MGESQFYAVFLYPQAHDALGDLLKPYLAEGPNGQHIICSEIDTGGAFCELTLHGKNQDGKIIEIELMIPTAMIRLIVSMHNDEGSFGFR